MAPPDMSAGLRETAKLNARCGSPAGGDLSLKELSPMKLLLVRGRAALFMAALGVAGLATPPLKAEAPYSFDETPGKLPKEVTPVGYRLTLTPDFKHLSITGREEIDVRVAKAVDQITLNAIALRFAKVSVGKIINATVTIDAAAQTATLHLGRTIEPGLYKVTIDYSGPIPETPAGLYYNDYATPEGKKRMLITQFESTDARRMFPGWDEPAFKATYALTVIVPKDLVAVSNMPIVSEKALSPALKQVRFAQTPKMSSYLVALAVGELDRIGGQAGKTDVGVWTVHGKAEQGRYALDAATRLLPYYNDYFGVDYPLPKLDMIAVPGNFAAGAMENWGAITYIDNALLFDPSSSSERTRRLIYLVVAHEMAHQWSGDLVTMAWWDDIWLNEGFASWMNNKAMDHFNPDWQVWLQAHLQKEQAMGKDARFTTHPIQQKITEESEIETAFDDITYLKGQSFIRMIEAYLGEEKFRAGMRAYMKAHAYSNATTADLWQALAQASGKPVPEIAAGFTEQPGIPLIHLDRRCEQGDGVVTLTQSRFTIHDPQAAKLVWKVPVTLGTIEGGASKALPPVLVGDIPERIPLTSCGAVVKANFGDTGYYRVTYDAASEAALAAAYPGLAATDRIGLLSDRWAAVEAGVQGVAGYLDLLKKAAGETELGVWEGIVGSLQEIDQITGNSPDRAAFRAFARGLLSPVLARIGWDAMPKDTVDTPLLRALMISALSRLEDAAVNAEVRRRFDRFLTDPASLPGTLRTAVIDSAARGADQALFDEIRALGKAASGSEEKLRYYFALAQVQDPKLIDQAVAIAATDEIPNGRVNRFLASVAADSDAPDLVWIQAIAIADPVLKKLTTGQRERLFPSIAAASNDPAIADKLDQLPETQSSPGARYEAKKAEEVIQFHANFRQTLKPALSAWLSQATK
jgi:aminopeptidase N